MFSGDLIKPGHEEGSRVVHDDNGVEVRGSSGANELVLVVAQGEGGAKRTQAQNELGEKE